MYGVVLWSDGNDGKAIIWCEDHGHLAYFNASGTSAHDGVSLDPGDLVQFDLSEERQMRRAHNPRLVAQGEFPTLPQDLGRAARDIAPADAARMPAISRAARSARKVVPLSEFQHRTQMAATG